MAWNPSEETVEKAITAWRSQADETISLMAIGRSGHGWSGYSTPSHPINHLDALEMVTKSLCDVIVVVCPHADQAKFWAVYEQAKLWSDHGHHPSVLLKAQSYRQIADTEIGRVRRSIEDASNVRQAGEAPDPLKATLAVLSPTLAKMVEFVAAQPGRQAHVDDITRRHDGISSPGSVCARRKTVRQRFDRARSRTESESTPLVLTIDDWTVCLKPRT